MLREEADHLPTACVAGFDCEPLGRGEGTQNPGSEENQVARAASINDANGVSSPTHALRLSELLPDEGPAFLTSPSCYFDALGEPPGPFLAPSSPPLYPAGQNGFRSRRVSRTLPSSAYRPAPPAGAEGMSALAAPPPLPAHGRHAEPEGYFCDSPSVGAQYPSLDWSPFTGTFVAGAGPPMATSASTTSSQSTDCSVEHNLWGEKSHHHRHHIPASVLDGEEFSSTGTAILRLASSWSRCSTAEGDDGPFYHLAWCGSDREERQPATPPPLPPPTHAPVAAGMHPTRGRPLIDFSRPLPPGLAHDLSSPALRGATASEDFCGGHVRRGAVKPPPPPPPPESPMLLSRGNCPGRNYQCYQSRSAEGELFGTVGTAETVDLGGDIIHAMRGHGVQPQPGSAGGDRKVSPHSDVARILATPESCRPVVVARVIRPASAALSARLKWPVVYFPGGTTVELKHPRFDHFTVEFRKPSLAKLPGDASTWEDLVARGNFLGLVCPIAMNDQAGCRRIQGILQSKAELLPRIADEIIASAVPLSVDPFGNYLVQKLIEVAARKENCMSASSGRITDALIGRLRDVFVETACNVHGTRVIQKLLETISGTATVAKLIEGCTGHVVDLSMNINGNHVVQKCVVSVAPDLCSFVVDEVLENIETIAKHRRGCCVVQRCIDGSPEPRRSLLLNRICDLAASIIEDPFGNYVIQYALGLQIPKITERIVECVIANLPRLSTQKFSSNVVEKCMVFSPDPMKHKVVDTIVSGGPAMALRFLSDPFGNYVIQRALRAGTPDAVEALVDNIFHVIDAVRLSNSGKRIASKLARKYPKLNGGCSGSISGADGASPTIVVPCVPPPPPPPFVLGESPRSGAMKIRHARSPATPLAPEPRGKPPSPRCGTLVLPEGPTTPPGNLNTSHYGSASVPSSAPLLGADEDRCAAFPPLTSALRS